MEIGAVSTLAVPRVSRNSTPPKDDPGLRTARFDSVSATFERRETTVAVDIYIRKSSADSERIPADTAEVARLRKAVHEEVLAQVRDFLGAFFTENPAALEKVSRSEIPDYFNVDNTARRILNIYFSTYEAGSDRQAFADRAREIISQAYADVENLVGELPGIVQETRSKVMEILTKFAEGGDVSDFMQITIE